MSTYSFTGKSRTVLMAFMGVGLLCMALTWFVDDGMHTRFWSNFLHNSVFFTGIAFMATFFISICITAYAGWHAVFKRIWEAFSTFLIPGLILMLIIALGVYLHFNHLYHWADAASVETDSILQGKASFLNKNWYLFSTLIIVGLWIFFARKLRELSIAEDEGQGENFSKHRKMRVYAAIFLPIAGFSSAAIIWQWVMSVDAHWYSTLFAWYAGASWFVAMIALTILMLIYLKSFKGVFQQVTNDHIHDLGKFLFAFSIFWTYLWFSQYMLIWYGNVGEETGYFKLRMDEYPVLFFGNLIINFVLPFFVLMRNDTKRKFGSIGIVALIVFVGHWIDFFLMLKPGILHTSHEVGHHMTEHGAETAHSAHGFTAGFTVPGLLEIGTFLGFGALFLFVFFTALAKAPLIAKNDPYLEESLHHHV